MQPPRFRSVLAALAIATADCSTVNPIGVSQSLSTATPSYQVGRAIQTVPTTADIVDRSKLAMEDVGIHTIVQRQEDRATVLEGKTAIGRRAVVSIQPEGTNSIVSARFGTIGDEPLSRAFLDRLNARAPEANVETKAAQAEPKAIARRPAPNRASSPPGSMLQNQLEGGYRDSVAP